MADPDRAHRCHERVCERNNPFLIAFPNDVQTVIALGVDGLHTERNGFAGPQAAGVHQSQSDAILGILNGGEKRKNLGMR